MKNVGDGVLDVPLLRFMLLVVWAVGDGIRFYLRAHTVRPYMAFVVVALQRTAKGGPYKLFVPPTEQEVTASESRVTATYRVSEFTSES